MNEKDGWLLRMFEYDAWANRECLATLSGDDTPAKILRLLAHTLAAQKLWLERLRARFAYGPSMHAKPLAAMTLSVMLLVGGGAYLGVSNLEQPPAHPAEAAVVHDLQTLDNNAQLLDQLESLSSSSSNEDMQ